MERQSSSDFTRGSGDTLTLFAIHCAVPQPRGRVQPYYGLQCRLEIGRTWHQLGFCQRIRHDQSVAMNVMEQIGLHSSLLPFCTSRGCGRLWFFSTALTRFSFSDRGKNHYYKSLEDKNNLQRVKAPSYLLLRVVVLFVWPFQTIFSDCVKVKQFSMMEHIVNGWWGWGELEERGIKLHLETKALTSGNQTISFSFCCWSWWFHL